VRSALRALSPPREEGNAVRSALRAPSPQKGEGNTVRSALRAPSPQKGEGNYVDIHETTYIIHSCFPDRHVIIALWLCII